MSFCGKKPERSCIEGEKRRRVGRGQNRRLTANGDVEPSGARKMGWADFLPPWAVSKGEGEGKGTLRSRGNEGFYDDPNTQPGSVGSQPCNPIALPVTLFALHVHSTQPFDSIRSYFFNRNEKRDTKKQSVYIYLWFIESKLSKSKRWWIWSKFLCKFNIPTKRWIPEIAK